MINSDTNGKMKILMLNPEYPPLGGGQGNANKAVFETLESEFLESVRVDIVTSSTDMAYVENRLIGDVVYLDIGKKGKNRQYQSMKDLITYIFKSFLTSYKLIKKNRYDLIVAWSGIPSGFIAFLLKLRFNTSYVVLLRGADVPFYDKRWEKLDKFVFRHISPFIWKKSAGVTANSVGLTQLAHKTADKQEIIIIPNGVDTDFYKPTKDVDAESPIRLAAVGRLNKIKGFDILIKSLAGIKQEFHLTIAGDGPEEDNLRTLINQCGLSGKIELCGYKNKSDLAEIYGMSDIFVLSSHKEGMSNSLLEAMAAGCAVVSSDVGGASELVAGNGVVVPAGDCVALSEALSVVMSDRAALRRMGITSRELALAMSWSAVTSKFMSFFRDAASSDK